MVYRVVCDSCGLDREVEDWVTAHELATDHETEFPSHWVSLEDRQ